MILLLALAAVVVLGLAAARWGADSRDGGDWRRGTPYPPDPTTPAERAGDGGSSDAGQGPAGDRQRVG